MAKSKAKIMLELEGLEIGYDSKQPCVELAALLKRSQEAIEAKNAPDQEAPTRAGVAPVKEVRLGLSTIQDHETRLTKIEAILSEYDFE